MEGARSGVRKHEIVEEVGLLKSKSHSVDQPSIIEHPLYLSLLYSIACGGLGLILSSLGPCILQLQIQTHSSPDTFTLVFTIRSVGYLCGAFVGGILLDKYPCRGNELLAWSLLFAGLTTALVPFAPSVLMLCPLVMFQGIGMGVVDTAGNCLLIHVWGERVGPWMQTMHFAFAFGAFISPLLVRFAMSSTGLGYGLAFWIFSFILFITSASLFREPTPPPRQTSEPLASHATTVNGDGSIFTSTSSRVVICAAVVLGLYVGAETGFGGFLLYYVHARLGVKEGMGQYLVSVYWGSLAFGRLIAIPLSLHLSPAHLLLFDLSISMTAMAWLAIWWNSMTAVWMSTCLFGFGMASMFPTVVSFVEESIEVTGRISSVFVIGASVGEMIIPLIIGVWTSNWNPAFVLVLALTVALCSIASLGLYSTGSTTQKYIALRSKRSFESVNSESIDNHIEDLDCDDIQTPPKKAQHNFELGLHMGSFRDPFQVELSPISFLLDSPMRDSSRAMGKFNQPNDQSIEVDDDEEDHFIASI